MVSKTDCVFCEKIRGSKYSGTLLDCVFFEPLNPIVPGHLLVVPFRHVENAGSDPWQTGVTMEAASMLASNIYTDYNLITSAGIPATQSVLHLHIHIVPRYENDGLHLPWTDQRRAVSKPDFSPKIFRQQKEMLRRLQAMKDGGGRVNGGMLPTDTHPWQSH